MFVKPLFRAISSIFIVILISIMIVVSCGYYYLTHTSQGARWLFDNLAGRYLGAKIVKYREFSGTIAQGIHLSNVRIEDLDKFTTRSLILIQQLDLAVPNFDTRKIHIKIRNGRIKFPLSDPVGFYGSFADGILKFNVYCGIIDVREIVTVVKSDLSLHNLKGTAKKASMTITGSYTHPILNGEFLLEDFRYLGFSLAQLPASFRYTLGRNDRGLQWQGDLSVPSGIVISRLTKIDLKPSRLIFTGPFKNPGLDINGSSKVNQTLINISLGGTKQKPRLNVTSNPPKSKNVILVMLATGQELIQPDNADINHSFAGSDQDFVEYFTFSSEGQPLEAVGLTNFSVNMQDDAKWLGIKKKVTDQLKVGINLQETRAVSTGGNTDVTRTIGGEVQVADHITLGVDKKVTQVVEPVKSQSSSEQKDGGMDVTIKYKKSF
jgi:hypothetical protein